MGNSASIAGDRGDVWGKKNVFRPLLIVGHLFPNPVFIAQFSINIIVKEYLHYSKGLKLAFPPLLSTSHGPA